MKFKIGLGFVAGAVMVSSTAMAEKVGYADGLCRDKLSFRAWCDFC